jgi:hypothetical protein
MESIFMHFDANYESIMCVWAISARKKTHSYDENYISIMCLWAISLRIGIKQEISKAHTTSYSSFIASLPHGKYCPHSWASSPGC